MINKIKVPADIALLITRVIIGGIFIYSGWMKVSAMEATLGFFSSMSIPAFLGYIVSYGELIGGVMLVLGLWTELAAIFLAIIMIVAVCLTKKLGFQMYGLPLSMLAGLSALAGCGAGKWRIRQNF